MYEFMNTKTIGQIMDYNKNQPLGETYTCLQGEGKYTLNDVVKFYEDNKHIKHTMITGGGPTIH